MSARSSLCTRWFEGARFALPDRRSSVAVAVIALAVVFLPVPCARAQSYTMETWVGAEAFHRAWSLYSGMTLAPLGSVADDGFRLRAVVGQGQYRTAAQGVGVAPFVDVLAGYQMQSGALTLKLFAGAAALADIESRRDLADLWSRAQVGPKVAVETWWTIGPVAWAALDVSWSQPHQVAYARTRAGWRALGPLSLGLEVAVVASAQVTSLRAGPFLRYEWAAGEVSVSGGVASEAASLWNGIGAPEREPSGYLTMNWLQRF